MGAIDICHWLNGNNTFSWWAELVTWVTFHTSPIGDTERFARIINFNTNPCGIEIVSSRAFRASSIWERITIGIADIFNILQLAYSILEDVSSVASPTCVGREIKGSTIGVLKETHSFTVKSASFSTFYTHVAVPFSAKWIWVLLWCFFDAFWLWIKCKARVALLAYFMFKVKVSALVVDFCTQSGAEVIPWWTFYAIVIGVKLITVGIDWLGCLSDTFSLRKGKTWITTCTIAIFIIESCTVRIGLCAFVIFVKVVSERALNANLIIELVAIGIQKSFIFNSREAGTL